MLCTIVPFHRLLQKCSLVNSSKSMERDSKRQTASQLALEAAQNRADLEAQRETLAKLTHEVSSLEHQLNQVGLVGICGINSLIHSLITS